MPNRRRSAAVMAVVASLVLAGCGGGGDDAEPAAETGAAGGDLDALVEAAKEEGTVVWYSGATESAIVAAAEAFEKEYGITVEYQRLVSAPLAQRFETEVDSGAVQVDVMSTIDPNFFIAQREADATIELTADELPSLEQLPEDGLIEGGAAALLGIGTASVTVNTDAVDLPASWDDLLDPQYDGEIILTDPRGSAAWAQMWSVILNDPEMGPEYIEQFAADNRIRQVVESAGSGVQQVAAGEGGMLVASVPASSVPLIEQGAPLDDYVLENPAIPFYMYLAVATDAPHPNAARLFTNWIMSEEGQSLFNGVHQQSSVLGDIPDVVPLPEGLAELDADRAAADLPRVLELLKLQ